MAWLLGPDGLVWVFQKPLNPLYITVSKDGGKKKNIQCVAVLVEKTAERKVSGEWPDWFELTAKQLNTLYNCGTKN